MISRVQAPGAQGGAKARHAPVLRARKDNLVVLRAGTRAGPAAGQDGGGAGGEGGGEEVEYDAFHRDPEHCGAATALLYELQVLSPPCALEPKP